MMALRDVRSEILLTLEVPNTNDAITPWNDSIFKCLVICLPEIINDKVTYNVYREYAMAGKYARMVFIHELWYIIKRTSEALRVSEFYYTKQQVNKNCT